MKKLNLPTQSKAIIKLGMKLRAVTSFEFDVAEGFDLSPIYAAIEKSEGKSLSPTTCRKCSGTGNHWGADGTCWICGGTGKAASKWAKIASECKGLLSYIEDQNEAIANSNKWPSIKNIFWTFNQGFDTRLKELAKAAGV